MLFSCLCVCGCVLCPLPYSRHRHFLCASYQRVLRRGWKANFPVRKFRSINFLAQSLLRDRKGLARPLNRYRSDDRLLSCLDKVAEITWADFPEDALWILTVLTNTPKSRRKWGVRTRPPAWRRRGRPLKVNGFDLTYYDMTHFQSAPTKWLVSEQRRGC